MEINKLTYLLIYLLTIVLYIVSICIVLYFNAIWFHEDKTRIKAYFLKGLAYLLTKIIW